MVSRSRLRRWHIWLGWIVGLPILIWTASGLFMAAWPIETVRGEQLLREVPARPLMRLAPPPAGPRPVKQILLEHRPRGSVWIVRFADGSRIADAASGRWLPPPSAAEARMLVAERYAGESPITAVARIPAAEAPLELRRPLDTWQVGFADGTHIYVDATTGEIVARRTELWRVYDFLWGLHIMDPAGRTDFNNPWLIGFAALATLTALLALILLPLTLRRRRRLTLD